MEWNGEFVKYISLMAHYFSFLGGKGGGRGLENGHERQWFALSMKYKTLFVK